MQPRVFSSVAMAFPARFVPSKAQGKRSEQGERSATYFVIATGQEHRAASKREQWKKGAPYVSPFPVTTHSTAARNGVPGAIRTRGSPLRRRILYPTEVREHIKKFFNQDFNQLFGIVQILVQNSCFTAKIGCFFLLFLHVRREEQPSRKSIATQRYAAQTRLCR